MKTVQEWLEKNNPLYLISVLFMLLGLYLAGTTIDNPAEVSVSAILSIFAIQNVYELIVVGMAIYLLKNKIQNEHGKMLLAFGLILMGDITFYQVRISSLSTLIGWGATLLYILLALIKFVAVIKLLNLKVYKSRIIFLLSSFLLVWISPKLTYLILDSTNFKYVYEIPIIYYIWLAAALIQVPFIVENWGKAEIHETINNTYLGDETRIWRWGMIFVFFLLPIQIFLNVMDSYRIMMPEVPVETVILPWVLCSVYFCKSMWIDLLEEYEAKIDNTVLITSFLIIFFRPHVSFTAQFINSVFLFVLSSAIWFTRKNKVGLAVFGISVVLSFGNLISGSLELFVKDVKDVGGSLVQTIEKSLEYTALLFGKIFNFFVKIIEAAANLFKVLLDSVYDVVIMVCDGVIYLKKSISKTMMAFLFIIVSFVFLTLGFKMSVKKKNDVKKEEEQKEEKEDDHDGKD